MIEVVWEEALDICIYEQGELEPVTVQWLLHLRLGTRFITHCI